MKIGIYIIANIIYLLQELYLGDRISSFSLLERWVVAALFVGRHFALDIYVFCLRARRSLWEEENVWSQSPGYIGIQFTWRQRPCAHPVTWQLLITVNNKQRKLRCAARRRSLGTNEIVNEAVKLRRWWSLVFIEHSWKYTVTERLAAASRETHKHVFSIYEVWNGFLLGAYIWVANSSGRVGNNSLSI